MPKLMIFFILIFIEINCKYVKYDASKLTQLSNSINTNYNAKLVVSMNNFSQEMISYYSWFASYGYCEGANIPGSCCSNNKAFFTTTWKIISSGACNKYFKYNFVIWRSDTYKKYIIAFPGTRNKIDELLDEAANSKLVGYSSQNDGIKVVDYFKDVAFEIKNLIFTSKIKQDINNHPNYQFISIGHSLGGAVATIVLYEGVSKGYINSSKNEPVLITFGQPRTGNKNFVEDFNKKIKKIFRVVRDGDIVVDVPSKIINNPYTHLGGLILINKEVTSMYYCPKAIGEDYPDKECQKSFKVNVNYHVNYFNSNKKLSMRCK